ncbi:MAG: glycosyltransferase, partial [Clostridia bacterium]|nr:glycosyltransferase [Clostridia bacterium]
MKKALYTATVVRTHINAFHVPFLKLLKDNGYEVHVAARCDYADGNCTIAHCDRYFDLAFTRNPFSPKNIRVFRELRRIIEEERYELVHCHTPVAAVVTRLAAARARKKFGTKVFYTAHGLHFYKGAPLKNWLLFYPIERLCAKLTDCLITINHEDYDCIKDSFSSKRTAIERIDSVGVNLTRFSPASIEEKEALKAEHGFGGRFILTYAAEFIHRKNH